MGALKRYADSTGKSRFGDSTTLNIRSFARLLRGSEYYCSYVTTDDVKLLIDIADSAMDTGYGHITAEIFTFLAQLLMYDIFYLSLLLT